MIAFSRLGIGTVQFGQDYGVNNAGGRTPEAEARRIVERAAAAGCKTIDTAAAYGDAEDVLGRILVAGTPYRIVTKSVALGGQIVDDAAEARFREGFHASLRRLTRPSVYGLLVHHAADLLAPGGERLYRALTAWRNDGIVERIGVSVYERAQIDAVLDRFDIDLVQLPFSVLDQRLLADGTLNRLKERGVEIHARSVFLQGLLLMERGSMPAYFAPVRPLLNAWDDRVAASGLLPVAAAVAYVLGTPQVDCAIVGFDSLVQLDALLGADLRLLPFATADLACSDPAFVNPGKWRLN